MQDDRFAHSVWDLEPGELARPDYEDYERVFLAAYREAFRMHASPSRVRPYVTRYMRYYVAAPWVRDFAHRHDSDPAAAEVAMAPLDPQVDWRHLARWLEGTLQLWYVPPDRPRPEQAQLAA